MFFIGVDLGTSAVKLLLMDENGKIHKIVSKEYPLYFPHPGWSEQKPEDWFEQSMAGLKELTAECDKSQIKGISFGGQMHGLVALDKDDEVIRPAILWNDGRTGKQVEYLNDTIGKEKLSKYTANIAFAGFTAPKILWMKENEPDNFAKITKVMLPKDYLAYKLSGSFCTEYSDASGTLLLDVEHKCWSKEMTEICGTTPDTRAICAVRAAVALRARRRCSPATFSSVWRWTIAAGLQCATLPALRASWVARVILSPSPAKSSTRS